MGNTASVCSNRRHAEPGKQLLKWAEAGNTDAVGLILAGNTHCLSYSSVFGGNTAWHKAAKHGQLEVFEAMKGVLACYFEVQNKGISDIRPAMYKLGSCASEVVMRLVNKGNVKGVTPLMLACTRGHTDAVAWLLKHGADIWRCDRIRRHTALHCAAQAGATDAIRLLLAAAGTTVHTSGRTLLQMGNHAGLTALHYAAYCEQHEVLQQLLAHNADITAQAEYPDLDWGSVNAGDTPMHIAASRGDIDAIQILLRAYNEQSGLLVPGSTNARRLRDPRAMRNDYGRLPYHLSMRKGYSWLAELLDPSVPVRFLLVGEQLNTTTTWGPRRLATIAAAVLHNSLVADLKAIKTLLQAEYIQPEVDEAVQASEATDNKETVCSSCCTTPRQPTAAIPEAAADAAAGQQRRLWASLSAAHRCTNSSSAAGHRRSNSGGAGTAASAGPGTPRAPPRIETSSSAVRNFRRVSNAASSAITGMGHSRRSSRGAQDFTTAPPSPLSPRMLVSVMLGSSSTVQEHQNEGNDQPQQGGEQECLAESGSPKAHGLAEMTVHLSAGNCSSGNCSSKAAISVDNAALPEANFQKPQQKQQQEQQEQQQEQEPELQQRLSRSGSFCSIIEYEADGSEEQQHPWSLTLTSRASSSRQQRQQQEGDGSLTPVLAGNAPPSPCGAHTPRGAGLDAFLQQFRWTAGDAAAGYDADSIADEDDHTCGVCLDELPTASIVPCNHTMCADCAMDMCERFALGTAVCPFCRCIIRGFAPANLPPASAKAGAAARAT